jgi:hypothetical protein
MLKVVGVSFDKHEYDRLADVLYLSIEWNQGSHATADVRKQVEAHAEIGRSPSAPP